MGYATSFVVGDTAYVTTGFNPQTPNTRLAATWAYIPKDIPAGPTGYDSADGFWKQRADYGGGGRSNAVGFAIGTKGYVGTGTTDGVSALADFYSYDPVANTWSAIAPMGGLNANNVYATNPRVDASAMGFDTCGVVMMGYDYQYYYGDVWQYSPTTNTWTSRAANPGNQRSKAITWVYNGKGYLVGGYTPNAGQTVGNSCYDFYKFDPTQTDANLWTRLRDISNTNAATYDDGYNTIVRSRGVGFVIKGTSYGDKGYVTTGSTGSAPMTYTWEYDFASDLWTEKTPFEGGAREGAVGFTVKNRGFVATGVTGVNSGSGYTDCWEFFPNQIYNQYD